MKILDRLFRGILIALLSIMGMMMVLILVAHLLTPLLTEGSDFIIIETECYDKHDNEIIGVACEREVYCGDNDFYGLFFKSEDCPK